MSSGEKPFDFGKYNATMSLGKNIGTLEGASRAVDLSGAADFVQIFTMDINPQARGGQVIVSGTVTDSTDLGVTYNHALIEANIIGYVCGQKNILCRGVIGKATGPIVHRIDQSESYSTLAVEARKIIDGAAGSTISPDVINCMVQARFFAR